MTNAGLFLLAIGASGAAVLPATPDASLAPAQEIVYASTDLRHLVVFGRDGARFGPPLDYRPGHPPAATRYFEPEHGVRCVSIGIPGNTTEYAIKRPISAGERYRCGRTSFRVVRCFAHCRAAIIEHDSRLADNLGAPEGYMYVNSCLGVLAFSSTGDPARGIPLAAELLRGNVGILADRNYPDCQSF